MSPSNFMQNGGGGGGGNGRNWIEHEVSKFDTLAGVAIKYGVEVADIKRMNGLATEIQMFALKTLRIPLPGRHPPTHSPPNGVSESGDNSAERKPPRVGQSGNQEPFQSLRLKAPRQKRTSAMSTLQTFYGLKSSNPRGTSEETELAVYRSASVGQLRDDWLPKASLADMGDGVGDKSDEKPVRRRQKSEVDTGAGTPERLLKEDNGGSNGFSSSTGKGLPTRAKSASRAVLFAETESGWLDSIPSIPKGLGESIVTEVISGVRKSFSASCLKEQDKSNSATVWPTGKWNLKSDLQALSTAAIANPIFNGLAIPIAGLRSKAALD